MNVFVVNGPYPIPLSGTEGFHYLCQDTGHLLCLGLRCPRLEEIEAIHGRTEFAVAVKNDLVHLLCRFGHNLPWKRVVASCHMTPPEVRWIPEDPKPGEGGLIHIHLVDSSTNVLRAMRALSGSATVHLTEADAVRTCSLRQARSGENLGTMNTLLKVKFTKARSQIVGGLPFALTNQDHSDPVFPQSALHV